MQALGRRRRRPALVRQLAAPESLRRLGAAFGAQATTIASAVSSFLASVCERVVQRASSAHHSRVCCGSASVEMDSTRESAFHSAASHRSAFRSAASHRSECRLAASARASCCAHPTAASACARSVERPSVASAYAAHPTAESTCALAVARSASAVDRVQVSTQAARRDARRALAPAARRAPSPLPLRMQARRLRAHRPQLHRHRGCPPLL
jgi:hypothetical protein